MKARLNYTVRTTRAPGEAGDSIVPVIVERLSPVDLETVVENCIDRGLVAGIKPTAAHGIAEGVAAQIAREFALGRGVAFGQYFYGRPYLSGTVDSNGRVTGANRVNVRLYKGSAFKLSRDDFSLSFDGAGDAVRVDSVYGDTGDAGGNTYGQVVENSPVVANGRNLNAAGDSNTVTFAEVGGEGRVVVTEFRAQGDGILSFAWPAGLVAGKAYEVVASRTDVNGVTRTSAPKKVTVVAAAPVPPTPIAQTSDGQVKVMSVSDGGQSETFTFGDEWTAGGEGFVGSAAQWFAELASVRTMPEADAVMASCQAIDANTLKIECDAGDAPAAGDYPNATLEIGMAHYESGELVTETLIVPIHLVVNE